MVRPQLLLTEVDVSWLYSSSTWPVLHQYPQDATAHAGYRPPTWRPFVNKDQNERLVSYIVDVGGHEFDYVVRVSSLCINVQLFIGWHFSKPKNGAEGTNGNPHHPIVSQKGMLTRNAINFWRHPILWWHHNHCINLFLCCWYIFLLGLLILKFWIYFSRSGCS